MEKHEAEKEGELYKLPSVCLVDHSSSFTHSLPPSLLGALEAQRVKYEEQLAKLKEQQLKVITAIESEISPI